MVINSATDVRFELHATCPTCKTDAAFFVSNDEKLVIGVNVCGNCGAHFEIKEGDIDMGMVPEI